MKNLLLIPFILLNIGFSGRKTLKIDVVPKEKQDEVLFKGPVEKGYFGGLVVKFSQLNDELACLVGARGGVILNHTFGIGGGLYGLVNRLDVHTNYPIRDYKMDFSYGGVILELIFGSRKLLHFGMNTLIGGGCVFYELPFYEEPWYDDAFFVLEPGMEMTLNVTRCLRIDIGGSYRYIYGTDLDGIDDKGLSGVAGHITFKFGKF